MDSKDLEGSNGRGQDEGGIRSGRVDGSQDKGIIHDEESRHLNFNICGDDFETKTIHRNKTPRDPMSHRIIEKRRRDRMNNCLADLSRLIPASYMKQGQGRIEKTEIIEMAITLINTLTEKLEKAETSTTLPPQPQSLNHCCVSQLSLGYQECKDEVMRYLVEGEGMCASDSFCDRVMGHLTVAGEKLLTSVSRIPADEKPEIKTSDIRSNFPEGIFNQQGPAQSTHSDLQLRNLLTNNERMIDSNDGHRNNRSDTCSHLSSLSSLTKPYSRAEGHYSTTSSDGTSFTEFLRPDSEKGSSGSGGGGQGSIYKFKHNITQRFSQEKNVSHPSDTSSSCSSSREDAGKLQRRKISKGKTRSQGSRISPYPSSSELSSGNTSNGTSSYHGDVSAVRSDSSNTPPDQGLNVQSSSNVPLPGFVLHPAGTHYFPISIHPTSIPECFRKSKLSGGMGLFHPISIPVQFFGPYIAMGDDRSIDNSIQSGSSWEPTQLPLTYAKVPGHGSGNGVL